MKKIQLKVITDDGDVKRTYHIMFDESEGTVYELQIGKTVYLVNLEGKILKTL